jgi:hypothetical protein
MTRTNNALMAPARRGWKWCYCVHHHPTVMRRADRESAIWNFIASSKSLRLYSMRVCAYQKIYARATFHRYLTMANFILSWNKLSSGCWVWISHIQAFWKATLSVDVLGFTWNLLWMLLEGHSAIVFLLGRVFLLPNVPIRIYIFTMANVLILSLTNHISISHSLLSACCYKAIQNVNYGWHFKGEL